MRFLTNVYIDGVLGIGTVTPSAAFEVVGTVKLASLANSAQSRILVSDNVGNIAYRNISDFITSITNNLSSSANVMSSTVNGVNSTASIVNSLSINYASGNLSITVNGVNSLPLSLPGSTDNLLSVTARGNETSYALITPSIVTKSNLNTAFQESRTASNNIRWAWIHRTIATGSIGEDLELNAYSDSGVPSSVMYWNRNNGNVGIGNTNPTTKLEVTGTTKTTNLQITNGAANLYLAQSDASGNVTWVSPSSVVPATPSLQAVTTAGATTNIRTSFTGGIIIDGGNTASYTGGQRIGLFSGYSSPISGKLLFGDGSGWKFNIGTGTPASNTDLFTILDTGNVGIGNNAPTNKLDVNGVINAVTGYRLNNTATTGTYLRGNGTNFVQSTIQLSDLPAGITANNWSLTGNSGTTVGTNFIGTTDVQDLVFRTNSTERVRIFSNGNIAIGGVSEYGKLRIGGSTKIDGKLYVDGNELLFGNSGNTGGQIIRMYAAVNNPATTYYYSGGVYKGEFGMTNGDLVFNPTNSTVFYIAGSPKMYIANNGNIGIGTITPSAKLDINGDLKVVDKFVIGSSNFNLNIGKTIPAAYPELNYNAEFTGGAAYTYTYKATDVASRILFTSTGFQFATAPNGTAGTNVTFNTLATFHNNGSIGIGTTTPNSSVKLDIGGKVNINTGTATGSTLYVDCSGTSGTDNTRGLYINSNGVNSGFYVNASHNTLTNPRTVAGGFPSPLWAGLLTLTSDNNTTAYGHLMIGGLTDTTKRARWGLETSNNFMYFNTSAGGYSIPTLFQTSRMGVGKISSSVGVVTATMTVISYNDGVSAGNTSASNALDVYNSNDTLLFRVRDDGNVGINQSTPSSLLHIKGRTTSTGNRLLRIDNNANQVQMLVDDYGSFVVGSNNPLNRFSYQQLYYNTGTASQSGTTVTGIGTTFNSNMVGMQFIFGNGSTSVITAYNSPTSLTVADSATNSSQIYNIEMPILQGNSSGRIGINIVSATTALHVKPLLGDSPLRVEGLANNTSTLNSSILITDANGVITKATVKNLTAQNNRFSDYTRTATNYTVVDGDVVIAVENEGTGVTISLPSASSSANRIITVKRVRKAAGALSTGTVTITPATNATSQAGNIELTDGTFAASSTLAAHGVYGSCLTYLSNGSEWEIIGF